MKIGDFRIATQGLPDDTEMTFTLSAKEYPIKKISISFGEEKPKTVTKKAE